MKLLNMFKKLVCVIMCVCVALGFSVNAEKTVSSECDISDINEPIMVASDAVDSPNLQIGATSAVLLEIHTGQILYDMNSSEVLPPASITKIMSLLLIMERINAGELSLDDVVSCSAHAASMGGSQIWLEEGESMTVDELLKATVIASANDATVALGEHIAGSEEAFVALMNARAKELGMNNTNFINCTGLDAEGHLTTAYDVALMSAALIKHPLIKRYSTVWMDTLRNGESELVNTNKLVRFYKGTTGLKTGTTSGAGYCLSATAERDGTELVAVIMGGNSSNERFEGAKKLLDFGFANYSFQSIAPEIKNGMKIKLEGGTKKELSVYADEEFKLLLKKGEGKNLSQSINIKKKISAPISKGDTVGSVDLYSGNIHLGSMPIRAGESVGKKTFKTTLLWILRGLFMP